MAKLRPASCCTTAPRRLVLIIAASSTSPTGRVCPSSWCGRSRVRLGGRTISSTTSSIYAAIWCIFTIGSLDASLQRRVLQKDVRILLSDHICTGKSKESSMNPKPLSRPLPLPRFAPRPLAPPRNRPPRKGRPRSLFPLGIKMPQFV